MPRVVLYTKRLCPYCDRAKHLLRSKEVEWEEIDIETDPDRQDEMVERSGGRRAK